MNKESEPAESTVFEDALSAKRQFLVGAAIAAAALVVVMLLMLLAVRRAPSAMLASVEPEPGDLAPEGYGGRNIVIERFEHDLRPGVTGGRELEIKGYIRNTGTRSVGSADLRCYFKTHSDTETSLDIPLIVATRLKDMDCGPLRPFSGRRFDVRFGNLPDNLQSEIIRYELVNITFLAP